MSISPAEIVNLLEKQASRPLTAREILGRFRLPRTERQEAVRLLDSLVEEGVLVLLKGKRYSLPRQINLVVGTLSAHRDGYGFVRPHDGADDVFIPARFVREAMDGDRVAARVERRGRYGKPEGRIIRVLERAHRTVVGRFEAGPRFGYVTPADPRLGHDITISPGGAGGARSGQVVVAAIEAYPEKNRNPEGTIIQVLGDPGDPEVEILTIVHKYGLPYPFPAEVQEAAKGVPAEVSEETCRGRVDLRRLPIVTIDGETARDFDDGVAVQEEVGGRIRLWVAIADVAHYVPEGGVIDREAYERGTSVYFPGKCIPMLPEALSNGICSLNPEVDRLTMVAEMVIDREGRRQERRFYPAVIRSRARLTYTEVRDMVVDDDSQTIDRYRELFPMLQTMEVLARRLTAMRRRRGSLDFDLPEAEIILDLRGRPENIVRSERNLAHRIIEEFMLAANEAVAAFLTEREAPLLYRVHDPPDPEKLIAFQEFIAHFNYGLNLKDGSVDPRSLQQVLGEAEGRPEERMINEILLRSMKQARYDPENTGHFGLAADLYCHFTSPIRRYPDLVVHRVLRKVLKEDGWPAEPQRSRLDAQLPAVGEHTSSRERRAMEAEREVVDLKKCQFMACKVGEDFDGYVSGVQPFGFFVELKEYFVEGLVHISSLGDDFYQFEEELHRLVGQHRRRIFQIGDAVRVRVEAVNPERKEIDFVLAEEEPRSKAQGPRSKVKRPRAQRPKPRA